MGTLSFAQEYPAGRVCIPGYRMTAACISEIVVFAEAFLMMLLLHAVGMNELSHLLEQMGGGSIVCAAYPVLSVVKPVGETHCCAGWN